MTTHTLLKHGCMLCALFVVMPPRVLSEPQKAPLVGEGAHDGNHDAAVDDVRLATFNGGEITLSDLQAAVDRKSRATKTEIAREGGRAEFLERMIDYDLLVLEAARRGYADSLAVRLAVKHEAVNALVNSEERAANDEVTDAAVTSYFAAHAGDFQRPALRRPSHIQLSDRAEAEAVRKTLVGASVEQFASVARKRSLDERTRKQGGQLGYCDELGQPWEGTGAQGCPVAFAKAVFALAKSGDLAPEPIEHDGAYSVVMLTGLMPAKVGTLERVRPKVVARLSEAARVRRIEALIARLRAENPVELHAELADQVSLPAAAPSDRPVGFPAAPPDPRAAPKAVDPDGS